MWFHSAECEKWISPSRRQTLAPKSIKFDISRRANDIHLDSVVQHIRFYFHTTRIECNSNADLIYREGKALIKIIPRLEFREESRRIIFRTRTNAADLLPSSIV